MHISAQILLVPDSGAIRTLFCSKPDSGMYVTEMMSCDWSMIIVDVFVCCEVVVRGVVICLSNNFNDVYFRHQKVSF